MSLTMEDKENIEYHVQQYSKSIELWNTIFVYDEEELAIQLYTEFKNNHKGKYRVALVRYSEEIIAE